MLDTEIWVLCAASGLGILMRPLGFGEWIWAAAGAVLLVACGLVPFHDAVAAVRRGTDVYLFLAGMMMLAELARREGVFDWIAAHAVHASRGSRRRLFCLVYGVGVLVTTVLSNDATAVVLTPAVAASVRRAGVEPLPYLFACAFIANAASFVLPISNPANFVVFAPQLPSLGSWLGLFALPSLLSVVVTYAALAWTARRELCGTVARDVEIPVLTPGGRAVVGGIGSTVIALLIASGLSVPLGSATFVCGALVLLFVSAKDREAFSGVVRSVSWTVLVLVAGLFVLVRSLENTGLLTAAQQAAETMARWNAPLSLLGAGGVTAAVSNITNNLPAGLLAGSSVASLQGHESFRAAVAIGIDLGPNLSVTGSLATMLWLIELRRERINVSAWSFLRVGMIVMPPALFCAVSSIALTAR